MTARSRERRFGALRRLRAWPSRAPRGCDADRREYEGRFALGLYRLAVLHGTGTVQSADPSAAKLNNRLKMRRLKRNASRNFTVLRAGRSENTRQTVLGQTPCPPDHIRRLYFDPSIFKIELRCRSTSFAFTILKQIALHPPRDVMTRSRMSVIEEHCGLYRA